MNWKMREMFIEHAKSVTLNTNQHVIYTSTLFAAALTQFAYLNSANHSPYYNYKPSEVNANGKQISSCEGEVDFDCWWMNGTDSKHTHELKLRQKLRPMHLKFLQEFILELSRAKPFVMGALPVLVKWQIWSVVLFIIALVLGILILLVGHSKSGRPTVLLPSVYGSLWETLVFGVIFVPLGALVKTDVMLKSLLHSSTTYQGMYDSTYMPLDITWRSMFGISTRATLLYLQFWLSTAVHKSTLAGSIRSHFPGCGLVFSKG